MKPVWFLDVDGVLNAVTMRPALEHWPDYTQTRVEAEGRLWPIWYSPTLMERISALHDDGLVEVRWLTTWEDHAPRSLAPALGLPVDCVVAGTRLGDTSIARWWKWPHVINWVKEHPEQPYIWTDDDLFHSVFTWAREQPGDKVLIKPETHVGLTPEHIAEIERFCRRQAGESAA